MQHSLLLQYSTHYCYNEAFAAATMQLSTPAYAALVAATILAAATIQLSPLIQSSSRRWYNAALAAATI